MKSPLYILYNLIYKPFLKLYLKTDSSTRFDGFKMRVLKEVFHPKLFFSTTYFYSFLKRQPVHSLKFLEIGSGSGILSMSAFKRGASVTAVDIDPKAVENTAINFKTNFTNAASATILQSDVFDSLPQQAFDMIVINPPYYFKKVTTTLQYAWYCGENGEYFEKLFSGLAGYVHTNTQVYMILEENCDIERIKTMAKAHRFYFDLADEKKIRWETSYIFKIRR